MKEKILKYWPYIAIITVGLLVWLLKPNPDRRLAKEYKRERDELIDKYKASGKRILSLRKDSITIRLRLKQLEEQTAREVKNDNVKVRNYVNKKIDYSKYTNTQLDSLRHSILPK